MGVPLMGAIPGGLPADREAGERSLNPRAELAQPRLNRPAVGLPGVDLESHAAQRDETPRECAYHVLAPPAPLRDAQAAQSDVVRCDHRVRFEDSVLGAEDKPR